MLCKSNSQVYGLRGTETHGAGTGWLQSSPTEVAEEKEEALSTWRSLETQEQQHVEDSLFSCHPEACRALPSCESQIQVWVCTIASFRGSRAAARKERLSQLCAWLAGDDRADPAWRLLVGSHKLTSSLCQLQHIAGWLGIFWLISQGSRPASYQYPPQELASPRLPIPALEPWIEAHLVRVWDLSNILSHAPIKNIYIQSG